jgi:hypothetical protein
MAVTARELAARRRFSGTSGTREYWLASGAGDDEDDARDALLAAAPATWEAGGTTLYRDDDGCEVFEVGTDGPWFGIAAYATQETTTGSGSNETSFEFDTTGGTQHLMASYSTVAAYGTHIDGNAANVADNAGMIGVTRDGAEGVDVPVGVLNFSITKAKAVSLLTSTYLDTLADMVGRTNNATFSGTTDDGVDFSYVTGECLFLGARGGVRNGQAIMTFLFSAASNKTGLTVGGITAIAKKGHEYLWIRYADTGKTKVPKAAYVEKVHLDGDFSSLACT